jgi:hypothetical protein
LGSNSASCFRFHGFISSSIPSRGGEKNDRISVWQQKGAAMKKIRLNVEFDMEMEVPDHVKVVRREDVGELLFVHGKLLEPQLSWEALSRINDDESYEFERISDELAAEIFDMIGMIYKSSMRVSEIADSPKKGQKP